MKKQKLDGAARSAANNEIGLAAYTKAALNSMVNLPIGVKVPGTEDAEAACRAREVPEWATHFALFDDERPYFTPDDHEAWVTKSARIKT